MVLKFEVSTKDGHSTEGQTTEENSWVQKSEVSTKDERSIEGQKMDQYCSSVQSFQVSTKGGRYFEIKNFEVHTSSLDHWLQAQRTLVLMTEV